MEGLVRFPIDLEVKQLIQREAKKLDIESNDFLQLLIKAYFNGVRLEDGEPASDKDRNSVISVIA